MEHNIQDIELLDGYLEGSLSEAVEEQVKNRLASDPSFAALLEDLKIMRQGIELSGMQQKIEELKKVDRELGPVKKGAAAPDQETAPDPSSRQGLKTGSSRLFTIWSVAASVLVLIGAGILILRENKDPSYRYAMQFSVPMEDYITVRGEEKNEILSAAMKDFNEEKYHRSIHHFEKIYSEDEYKQYNIYYGYALMKVNEIPEAIRIFDQVEENDPGFRQAACFYSSLCLIAQNKRSGALKKLDVCLGFPGSFSDEISEVRKSLSAK